jgi:probable F420-dependent oxidoreductase
MTNDPALDGALDAPERETGRPGRFAVWANLDRIALDAIVDLVGAIEAAGYDAFWINEGAGTREPFALLGRLAAARDRLWLGVGIAQTYARDPLAAFAGALTVAEATGGRFVMGLGVGHPGSIREIRGHEYLPPLVEMRTYLDGYRAASAHYRAPRPTAEPPLVIAALRRRMLELAATAADGAFPYLVPVEYVARARAILDAAAAERGRPRPFLVVTQPVVASAEPGVAREAARGYVARYLALAAYRTNLLECGFEERDLADGGSDRLLDALVAWGTPEAIRARLRAIGDAGADHVSLVPLAPDGSMPDRGVVEVFAPPW